MPTPPTAPTAHQRRQSGLIYRTTVAKNIRVEMARAGLDQKDLAARLGVSPQWVSRRIADPAKTSGGSPTIDDVAQIALVLGVSVQALTKEVDA